MSDDVIVGSIEFSDTIDLSDSPKPVSVDFGTSTIIGDGTDTFDGAEAVIGTRDPWSHRLPDRSPVKIASPRYRDL